MTHLALIGYGKMGMEVEAVAKEKGVNVLRIFTEENNVGSRAITPDSLQGVDVCIDFSVPSVVMENIRAVAKCGKNLVVGTTGWYDKLDEVKKIVRDNDIGFLYASNFSLGVNIFMHLVRHAADVFDKYAEYDVALGEVHHNRKADSPSGTALSLGSLILQNMRRKTELLTRPPDGQIKPQQLHIASTRVGTVTGTHTVTFDSEADAIELVHTAKNRRGFAAGAVVAARWLKDKKGFYTMSDVIQP